MGINIGNLATNASSDWWQKEATSWILITIVAYVIGTIWDTRYVTRCFAPCYDFLYKECDVYKLMDVTQTGIEYGIANQKKSDGFSLNYFETLYVVALNTNWEYEKALSYLAGEWKSDRNANYKNVLLRTKMGMACQEQKREEYLKLYNELPERFQRDPLYAAQKKQIQGAYQEAVKILKKVKRKSIFKKVQDAYILAGCYVKLGLKDEAKEYLEYVIDNGNALVYKQAAVQMYQEL